MYMYRTTIFKNSPLKIIGQLKAIFYVEPPLKGGHYHEFIKMVLTSISPCSNMVKTFKNSLLWNPKSDYLETWQGPFGTKVYMVYINNDPWLPLTYF